MKIIIAGKSIEVENEKLKEALEGEKESFELPSNDDLIVRTKDEQDKFIDNTKKEIVNTALEMEVKKWRNDLGLEFEGKTMDNLVEALKSKHKEEFTKEPSEQLEAKDKDIEKLKETIKSLSDEKEGLSSEFNTYKNQNLLNSELKKYLPKNLSIPEDDAIDLLKIRLKPNVKDGKVVYEKNGEVLKDNSTLDPLGSETVLKDFFSENKHFVKGLEGGQGGGDSNPNGGKSTFDVFKNKMETAGVNEGSEQFNKEMMKSIEAKEIDPADVN